MAYSVLLSFSVFPNPSLSEETVEAEVQRLGQVYEKLRQDATTEISMLRVLIQMLIHPERYIPLVCKQYHSDCSVASSPLT